MTESTASIPRPWWRHPWLLSALRLAVTGLLLGWVYDWAGPSMYPPNAHMGMGRGALHGALMPMALPALVMGRDVRIFAEPNSGRPYKIGYIVGINACGLFFFGSAFWRPRSRSAAGSVDSRPPATG